MFDPEEPESGWKKQAVAIEYWIIGALVVGAWVYGIVCGISEMIG